jgi:hypothetical protein
VARIKIAGIQLDGGRSDFSVMQGVCVVHITGVLLTALYLKTLECAVDIITTHDCMAGVLDYSRAAIAMTARDFMSARDLWDERTRAVLRLPVAIVASRPMLKPFRGVLWDSMKKGYERTLFTDPLSAWDWASGRAREVRALRQAARDQGFDLSVPGEQWRKPDASRQDP